MNSDKQIHLTASVYLRGNAGVETGNALREK
jgi:hypothetical protein